MATDNSSVPRDYSYDGSGKRTLITIVLVLLAVYVIGSLISDNNRGGDGNISSKPSITVNGEGEEFAAPDVVLLSYGVTEESRSVADAQNNAAKKSNTILTKLKEAGIQDADIKTVGYNIYPRYEYDRGTEIYPPSGRRTLAAYVVSQNFDIKVRNLADAGKIMTLLGSNGATDISGLNFVVDKQDEVMAKAREEAVKNAKVKAEALAEQLGVRLVRVIGYSESGVYPPVMYKMDARLESAAGSANPVLPAGENRIVANVSVTYEIR